MYAASTTGYGASATALLSSPVTTDASGNFTIPGSGYTCSSSNTQIYLLAQGGNPGLTPSATNSALSEIAVWGSCGDLTTSTSVYINEVTTAATAWALAPFMKSATQIGTSSTNATGLINAIATAHQLASISTGASPGTLLSANLTVESAKVYSLANTLASCTLTSGGAPCTTLFNLASPSATISNTTDAALAIVRNPARNVAALYALAPATPPYAGKPAAPADWTISITSTSTFAPMPTALALDANGRLWAGNYSGGAQAFNPTGEEVFPGGINNPNLNTVLGLAVDPSGNAWITSGSGNSVFKFDSNGTNLSGTSGFTSSVKYPIAVATDTAGNAWVANNGNSSAVLLSSTGTPKAQGTVYFVDSVATDADGSVWAAGTDRIIQHISTSGATSPSISCCQGPIGIALDRSGNIWVADYNDKAIVRVNASTGAVASRTALTGGLFFPQGIAVDGAGDVWATNYLSNSFSELAGAANHLTTGDSLSPATGFGTDVNLNLPYSAAIDASGNLWVSSSGDGRIVRFVGLATPVKTPLTGPAQLP